MLDAELIICTKQNENICVRNYLINKLDRTKNRTVSKKPFICALVKIKTGKIVNYGEVPNNVFSNFFHIFSFLAITDCLFGPSVTQIINFNVSVSARGRINSYRF